MRLIIASNEDFCKSYFAPSSFWRISLTLGFEIDTDVVIISLNIALSRSSSKDENR